ncbi:MAG TPA: ATP-binding protein [Gemmatimonadaceae bacterium]|nr:ATP-binding protein [Gemmatimonadaceae bacterium]
MIRRLSSIDWKFPLVMSGLILATATLFVWAAYAQFTAALYEETGERLRSGARFIAPLVGAPTPARSELATMVTTDERVRAFLRTGRGRAAAGRVLALADERAPLDTLQLRVSLLSSRGEELLARPAAAHAEQPRWAAERVAADSTFRPMVGYSPIFSMGGTPVYQVVSAVVARGFVARADTTLGYFVETRALVGRGQNAIRELLGAGTLVVGSREGGVWTDLESVIDGPPPIPRTDSVMIFDVSPRGPGIGVAQPVEGTPWVVWVQQSRAAAIAPVNAFIWRIAPVAAAIALMAALIVWLLSRQITNRLVALTYEVDRMEAGQGQPVNGEPDTDDEIERLESAFERMSARVEQQQRLEAQLMQSQKIEAVGRLAGGIAHDFNNVLTVVRNYSELVRAELDEKGEAARDMDEVLRATERAAGLTRQLLAFSRQQVIEPSETDVNEVIAGSQRMLTRLIPSNVVFETVPDPDIARVSVDPGQLEQVLLNLTINAVDAMPNGGTLTIRTMMVELDETFPDSKVPPRGAQVCITVSDTGTGMDRETRERIFEPFFTTKDVGKGTGLGLATAHGIVTQSGGRIWVYSEPGEGTTFKIYFPAIEGTGGREPVPVTESDTFPAPITAAATNGAVRRPRATVLVVEDDPGTLEVTRQLLERSGFRIRAAEHASAALAVLAREHAEINLVVTDVMMPGMSGVELAARIGERWPAMPVVMMSGYSDAEVRAKGALGRQRSLIEKPFTAAGLLSTVESALRGE